MRALILVCVALLLAGCADPYRDALETAELQRPEPPMTPADRRALAPYDTPIFD